MREIKNPGVIWTKAILFLALGIGSAILLLLELGTLKGAVLLALSIWAFCRTYYFAFYVVEKSLDPSFRFSGLISLIRHLASRKRHP